MAKKATNRSKKYPERAAEVPITQAMLYLVRDELKADIRGTDAKLTSITARFSASNARFDSIDAKLASVDKRLESVDAKFESIDRRFDSIDKRFDSVDAKFESIDRRFDSIDKRFDSVDARFAFIDRRFDSIDAKFVDFEAKMEAKFEGLKSEIHRLALLIEEQNARNKIVLDGLTSLFARQDRLEKRVDKLEGF